MKILILYTLIAVSIASAYKRVFVSKCDASFYASYSNEFNRSLDQNKSVDGYNFFELFSNDAVSTNYSTYDIGACVFQNWFLTFRSSSNPMDKYIPVDWLVDYNFAHLGGEDRENHLAFHMNATLTFGMDVTGIPQEISSAYAHRKYLGLRGNIYLSTPSWGRSSEMGVAVSSFGGGKAFYKDSTGATYVADSSPIVYEMFFGVAQEWDRPSSANLPREGRTSVGFSVLCSVSPESASIQPRGSSRKLGLTYGKVGFFVKYAPFRHINGLSDTMRLINFKGEVEVASSLIRNTITATILF